MPCPQTLRILRITTTLSLSLVFVGCGDLYEDIHRAAPEAQRAGEQLLTYLAIREIDSALSMVDPVSAKNITRELMEGAASHVPRNLVPAETASRYKINKTINAATESTDIQAALLYEFRCEVRTCVAHFLMTRKAGAFYLNSIRVDPIIPPNGER